MGFIPERLLMMMMITEGRAFTVGGLGFEFACPSPVGGMLFGVSGLLLLLLFTQVYREYPRYQGIPKYALDTEVIIIIIKRRSGINPIPPTIKDRD